MNLAEAVARAFVCHKREMELPVDVSMTLNENYVDPEELMERFEDGATVEDGDIQPVLDSMRKQHTALTKFFEEE